MLVLAALPAWLFTWISHIWVQVFMLNVVVMPLLLGPASVLGSRVCFSLKPPPFYEWKPPWVQTPSWSTVSFLYLGFSKVFLPQPPKWGVNDCCGHQLALQLFEYYFPNACEDWVLLVFPLKNIGGNNPVRKIGVFIYTILGNWVLTFL